ncbi:hypothetical protein LTR42_008624 [Elasticomyces elasticus]|nr:hypothetical protein LTR42_008624 [Elasticomyces elasticus]
MTPSNNKRARSSSTDNNEDDGNHDTRRRKTGSSSSTRADRKDEETTSNKNTSATASEAEDDFHIDDIHEIMARGNPGIEPFRHHPWAVIRSSGRTRRTRSYAVSAIRTGLSIESTFAVVPINNKSTLPASDWDASCTFNAMLLALSPSSAAEVKTKSSVKTQTAGANQTATASIPTKPIDADKNPANADLPGQDVTPFAPKKGGSKTKDTDNSTTAKEPTTPTDSTETPISMDKKPATKVSTGEEPTTQQAVALGAGTTEEVEDEDIETMKLKKKLDAARAFKKTADSMTVASEAAQKIVEAEHNLKLYLKEKKEKKKQEKDEEKNKEEQKEKDEQRYPGFGILARDWLSQKHVEMEEIFTL